MSHTDKLDAGPTVRLASEVAQRCVGLVAVSSMANGDTSEEFLRWVDAHAIRKYLTPEELQFFASSELDSRACVAFSWRAEALVSLLWALRKLDPFPPLNVQQSVLESEPVKEIFRNPQGFIGEASLRGDEELLEKESELFDSHWQVRDAELFGRAVPSNLDPSVVYERRYALSWLVGWGDGWDDVPTDT